MGFQEVGFNGMAPMGAIQPAAINSMQAHASSSFMQNPILPSIQVPFYQPPIGTQQPGAPLSLTNGNTNTIHYGNQFYDNNSCHQIPSFAAAQLGSSGAHLPSAEFSSNRLALHSHGTLFNRFSSGTSLDNVSLDKELPDLGQLNSPLFSDASYNHGLGRGLCSPNNEFSSSQSPSTSATNSLTSTFDIGRKRSGCLDALPPNSKQMKLLSGIPTPSSQEIDNGLDIFSGQTTPRSAISTSTSAGTPDSLGAPCISSHIMPEHFTFKPSCDALDLINVGTSSCSSSENNYWGNFDSFDPSLTPEDLLNESSIKPYIASQKTEDQVRQRKLDALDMLESLAQSKDSLTSPNTDNRSSSKDDISLKSHNSLVAGSPFQLANPSESLPVESVLNENSYDPVDDNEVFESKEVTVDSEQSCHDLESRQSAQESTEGSTSDSSPIKVRSSILSSTDGQIIPRSRFYSSHYSDLPTPLSVSSHFSCPSPLDNNQANGRISPVAVVIPPEAVAHEYMQSDPLLPPLPPAVNEELDLHPEVPIIQVCE